MISYKDAQLALARALYHLLIESDEQEWFEAQEIVERSGLNVRSAFGSRVMRLSLDDGEYFEHINEEGLDYFTLGAEGFALAENPRDLAIASDRFVEFNHNDPDARKISEDIEELIDNVRGSNDPTASVVERDRVIGALEAAKQLWNASSFRILQLRVGILLAVSDAGNFLRNTSKGVTAALLTDAIKAFVKSKCSIDVDAL